MLAYHFGQLVVLQLLGEEQAVAVQIPTAGKFEVSDPHAVLVPLYWSRALVLVFQVLHGDRIATQHAAMVHGLRMVLQARAHQQWRPSLPLQLGLPLQSRQAAPQSTAPPRPLPQCPAK